VVESKAPRWMAVLAAREMPFAEVPVTMGNEQTACELREEQLGVGLSTFESLSRQVTRSHIRLDSAAH
jgi:hypothetical protein